MNDGERDTLPPYSPEEAAQIRKALVTPNAPMICPRCGSHFLNMGPVAGGGSVAILWQFRCDACRRNVMLLDVPEQRKSGEW